MLRKLIVAKLFIILILGIAFVAFGHEFKEGNLTLKELLQSSEQIANAIHNKKVNKEISGQRVSINGILYEIRYFSFEDTKGKLPKKMTFKSYAKKNKLLDMKSIPSEPLPGIEFESFDFRRANLNDGVYFSMALRVIDKGSSEEKKE